MTQLEVIASTREDAVAAELGGASSVEVCVDLAADGLTPPLGVVRAIRDAVQIDMNVMLRPHNNGFVYSEDDIAQMLAELETFTPLGIQTIVFGAHMPDGALDVALIRRIAEVAAPVPLTVHRALEWSSNPAEALPELVGLATRVLTSGPANSAPEGVAGLRKWVATYGAHFRFAAAGGIRLDNIRLIAETTGVDQCHVGTAARTAGVVDAVKVRELVAALRGE